MSQPFPPTPASQGATVPNNMVLAIIAVVVSVIGCCAPHGIVSLIFAIQVNKKAATGDLDGAATAAKQAKMFAWISIGLGVLGLIADILFGGLTLLSAALSH